MLCKDYYLKIENFSKANNLDREAMIRREKDTNMCKVFTLFEKEGIRSAQETTKLFSNESTKELNRV
jgi:hypothetical protein